MKAAVCHEFGKPLVIEDIDIDAPGPGEVRVRVAACAICQSDIHYKNGAWGGVLPTVYGHEAAGVVDVIGPGVSGLSRGDHVVVSLIRSCGHCFHCARGEPPFCESHFPLDEEHRLRTRAGTAVHQGLRTGAFAEYTVVDQSQLVRIPSEVPLESASLLACGVITGFGAVVNTAHVPAGSSVAVIGTGGVGINSVQGAALSGALKIIAIDIAEEKLEAARRFGATHGINPLTDDTEAMIRDLTGGRGVDFVFVTVGSAAAIERGMRFLRRAGTLVLVGMPPEGVKAELEILNLADDGLRIVGSKMGSTRLPVDVPRLIGLYERGALKLDELVTGRFPLSEINQAIEDVARPETLRNVIVF